MVSLQEQVRTCSCASASAGAVKVELGRAFAARGVYVEEGQRRQVRQRHEQDIRAVRYYSQYSTETVVGRVWQRGENVIYLRGYACRRTARPRASDRARALIALSTYSTGCRLLDRHRVLAWAPRQAW